MSKANESRTARAETETRIGLSSSEPAPERTNVQHIRPLNTSSRVPQNSDTRQLFLPFRRPNGHPDTYGSALGTMIAIISIYSNFRRLLFLTMIDRDLQALHVSGNLEALRERALQEINTLVESVAESELSESRRLAEYYRRRIEQAFTSFVNAKTHEDRLNHEKLVAELDEKLLLENLIEIGTVKKIGAGAFGTAWIGKVRNSELWLCIKIMSPLGPNSDKSIKKRKEAALERFRVESICSSMVNPIAQALNTLFSQKLTKDILNIRGSKGNYAIFTEFIPGQSYDKLFHLECDEETTILSESGNADKDEVQNDEEHDESVGDLDHLAIQANLCMVMAMVHHEGVVHQDLKPANMIVRWDKQSQSYKVFVVDFGLSRHSETNTGIIAQSSESPLQHSAGGLTVEVISQLSGSLASSGTIMNEREESAGVGTPIYMAPEQMFPHENMVCPQSDVWAVGMQRRIQRLSTLVLDDRAILRLANHFHLHNDKASPDQDIRNYIQERAKTIGKEAEYNDFERALDERLFDPEPSERYHMRDLHGIFSLELIASLDDESERRAELGRYYSERCELMKYLQCSAKGTQDENQAELGQCTKAIEGFIASPPTLSTVQDLRTIEGLVEMIDRFCLILAIPMQKH